MAKFVFNMQNLLGVKEKLEEQSKTEYGKALSALKDEEDLLNNLKEKKIYNIQAFQEGIRNSITPDYFRNINEFISYLDKQVEEQIKNVAKAEEFAEEKRLKLLTSMKERKILETLRENKKEEYFREELKSEQKIIDEIVSFKYNNG